MSVKLGRMVFRRIGGRIVPIRIGAEAKTLAAGLKGISTQALRKVDAVKNSKSLAKINEFLKDSVVRQRLFHGTNNNFSKFSHEKIGSNVGHSAGRGFYLTDQKWVAQGYGKKVKEVYVNMKKPTLLDLNDGVKSKLLKKSDIDKLIKMHKNPIDALSNYGDVKYEGIKNVLKKASSSIKKYNTNELDAINDIAQSIYNNDLKTFFKNLRKVSGIDGVIASNTKHKQFIVYNSDQIMKAPKVSRLYKNFRGKK